MLTGFNFIEVLQMKLLISLLIASLFLTTGVQAEDVTGTLSFSYPAKGYFIFGFKSLDKEDKVCTSKYMIPAEKKSLIDLVKTPENKKITVAYKHAVIDGGGTRLHCVVDTISVMNS